MSYSRLTHLLLAGSFAFCVWSTAPAFAETPKSDASSLSEDKKARALLDAGDNRFDAGEFTAALDLYKAMLDRYPASRWRFLARLKIGKQFLVEKKYALALDQFRRVAVEENTDADQVGDASLQIGVCYYETGKFEEAFVELRKVIRRHPGTPYSNDAYFYIGQAHFKLGSFANAIEAFKNVGTSVDASAQSTSKLDAGKRMFIRIEDRDLSAQASEAGLNAVVEATSGDKETITCFPITQGAPIFMGSLRTQLGHLVPGDGILQVTGTDKIKVTIIDKQTASGQINVPRVSEVQVVGNARVKIVDGAFAEQVGAVVLGKPVFLLVQDADRDTSPKADTIEATVRVKRPVDDPEAAAKATDAPAGPETPARTASKAADASVPQETPARTAVTFKVIGEKKITLTERPAPPPTAPQISDTVPKTAATPQVPVSTVHTGVFTGEILLVREGETCKADALSAQVGDVFEIEYNDILSSEAAPVLRKVNVKVIEGNLNSLQVANTQISDEQLKFKTALNTGESLKNIGNIYKDLGLAKQATEKYKQALAEVEQVAKSSGALNQSLLEHTYVQMWKIYFAMDDLSHASQICLELQRRFPDSPFVDEALLLMGQVRQKEGKFKEAIGIYNRLAALKISPLAPAAQYAIGECYEQMGNTENSNNYDQAFQAFTACYEKFPNSNQAGDALSKMAEYYCSKKNFTRALDLYEEALAKYQDSKFIDIVLYNYGRTLVKMKRLDDAVNKFNQLISNYPNSKMIGNAQKILEVIQKRKDHPGES